MTAAKISNHVDAGLARLLAQFQDKPKLEGFIGALVDQAQDIEDACHQLIEKRWISSATGATLDRIGEILDLERMGQSDAGFRSTIIGEISKNWSFGRVEDLISTYKNLTGSSSVIYDEIHPAGIYLAGVDSTIEITDTTAFFRALSKAKPAGVNIVTAIITFPPTFSFDADGDGLGFGDASDTTVGGNFATLL